VCGLGRRVHEGLRGRTPRAVPRQARGVRDVLRARRTRRPSPRPRRSGPRADDGGVLAGRWQREERTRECDGGKGVRHLWRRSPEHQPVPTSSRSGAQRLTSNISDGNHRGSQLAELVPPLRRPASLRSSIFNPVGTTPASPRRVLSDATDDRGSHPPGAPPRLLEQASEALRLPLPAQMDTILSTSVP